MEEIQLRGCRFEPLINYLKALGVLRTVSMQKDASARGFWRGSHFVLLSELGEDELIDFFLDEYRPSPVFSPWNFESGFYPMSTKKEAIKTIEGLRKNTEDRLSILTNTIRLVDEAIEKVIGKKLEEIDNKTIKDYKHRLMAYCRNTLPDEYVEWLDTVYALILNDKFDYNLSFAIVMGTGGNDSRLEFSVNYLKSICHVFDMLGEQKNKARSALEKALFDIGEEPVAKKIAIGFFHPGGVGGPNAAEGFEGDFLSNPWDFILMVEGVLLLAGSVNRRLGTEALPGVASFPFSVKPVNGGANVISAAEGLGTSSRGELWMPLWEKPLGMREMKRLFSEGRASIGRRTADDGLDFARALATLGVSRGLKRFVRYGIYKRSGESYLAVPLALLSVREEKLKGADLLSDIDNWLSSIRNLATDDNKPARARRIPRQVYDCIFQYLQKGDESSFQRLLIYLGNAQMVLSDLSKAEEFGKIPPINLDAAWAYLADDGTPEFRIAYALAGIGWTGADLHPIRMDLHQVAIWPEKHGGHRAVWSDKTEKSVQFTSNTFSFLVAILEQRCLLGKKEEKDLVPIGSVSSASLDDVRRFLDGSLDYRRIVDLFLGLILVNDPRPPRKRKRPGEKVPERAYELPRDYVLLKSCYLPEPLTIGSEKVTIPYDLKIGSLLRARRLGDACSHAARKLKTRGIVPVSSFGREGIDPVRLYASLLIPVDINEFAGTALPLIRKRDLVRIR